MESQGDAALEEAMKAYANESMEVKHVIQENLAHGHALSHEELHYVREHAGRSCI